MVQYYSIAGAKVGSHYLAMGVLGALFGGAYLGVSGGSKAAPATPPINASSSDEADFIKKFLEDNSQDQKKEAAKH